MPIHVEYHVREQYRSLPGLAGTYPALGVTLRHGGQTFRTLGILDSGSLHTVFERRYAQVLGIEEVESGEMISAVTFGGLIHLYQFQVEMRIELAGFDNFFPARICFRENTINRNILGRVTVFSRLQLGFREEPQHIYLAPEP